MLKIALGVVLGGVVLAGACFLIVGGLFVASESESFQQAVESQRVVTATEFNRVADGMSYAEVIEIIGDPGVEQSRSTLGGITTVMYAWTNNDFSNMNAMWSEPPRVDSGGWLD